jgi:hypothetical protein
MFNESKKWGIEIKKPFNWKEFNVDIPAHIMPEVLERTPGIILERHTSTFIFESSNNITSKVDMFYHKSMNWQEISELIQKAVKETRASGLSTFMDEDYKRLKHD